MTERTSERVWRAARAAYENRAKAIGEMVEDPNFCSNWDERLGKLRDIEYDAMVAAFEAVPIGGLADSDHMSVSRVLKDRVKELGGALKPFAEYAERIEKERPGWWIEANKFIEAEFAIPMSWFIAALKAYRGEVSELSKAEIIAEMKAMRGEPDVQKE